MKILGTMQDDLREQTTNKIQKNTTFSTQNEHPWYPPNPETQIPLYLAVQTQLKNCGPIWICTGSLSFSIWRTGERVHFQWKL